LIAGCPRALRLARCTDAVALHLAMVEQVARRARDFDLVHWHIDYLHFAVSRRERYPNVTTLHGRLDLPDIFPLFAPRADLPLVSISTADRARRGGTCVWSSLADGQRAWMPELAWHAPVSHGFPEQLYRFEPHPGDY